MAMSRTLSQSLTRAFPRPATALTSHLRYRSNKTPQGQVIELDLESPSPSQPDSPEAAAELITVGVRKLEEAIHRLIVRRAAPDWLPFLPGQSYWVPPRATSIRGPSSANMIEAFGKFASEREARNRGFRDGLMSEDEKMSLSSSKGWPSSAVFIQGTSPEHHIPVIKVQVEKNQGDEDCSEDTSTSKGEEGRQS